MYKNNCCKIKFMKGYTFRKSNPAMIGVAIIEGELKVGDKIFSNNKHISNVKSIQHEKDSLSKIEAGKVVVISLPNTTVGKQINEGQVLHTVASE